MHKVKLHSGHIECAVVTLLNYRVYTVVPNVSYGLNLGHECDLLCLDQKGHFMEVEIKISLSDLKADFKKGHDHRSKYIGRLVYAFPEEMLEKAEPLIPKKCGIIVTRWAKHAKWGSSLLEYQTYDAHWHRMCKHDPSTLEVPVDMKMKFMQLGCMRIWTLKRHNNGKLRPDIATASPA